MVISNSTFNLADGNTVKNDSSVIISNCIFNGSGSSGDAANLVLSPVFMLNYPAGPVDASQFDVDFFFANNLAYSIIINPNAELFANGFIDIIGGFLGDPQKIFGSDNLNIPDIRFSIIPKTPFYLYNEFNLSGSMDVTGLSEVFKNYTITNTGTMTISGSKFNLTSDVGIYRVDNKGTMTIANSGFICSASNSGKYTLLNTEKMTISNGSFICTADVGVYTIGNSGTMTIANNTAFDCITVLGKYTFNNTGTMTIAGGAFNFAAEVGVYTISNAGAMTIANNCMLNFGVKDGGNYSISNTNSITIASCTLNFASDVGNYTFANAGTMTLVNDTINFSSRLGNYIINNTVAMTVSNTTLNFASKSGGNYRINNAGTITISNGSLLYFVSKLDANYLINNSGSITVAGNSTLNFTSEVGNYMIKNTGVITINNDTLSFNSQGGKFMVSNTGTMTLNNSTFKGSANALTAQSSSFFMEGDDLIVSNREIHNIATGTLNLTNVDLSGFICSIYNEGGKLTLGSKIATAARIDSSNAITVKAGTNVSLDISSYTEGNQTALLGNYDVAFKGSESKFSLSVNVSKEQAVGKYVIADVASGFDKDITLVCGSKSSAALSVGSILEFDGKVYSLSKTENDEISLDIQDNWNLSADSTNRALQLFAPAAGASFISNLDMNIDTNGWDGSEKTLLTGTQEAFAGFAERQVLLDGRVANFNEEVNGFVAGDKMFRLAEIDEHNVALVLKKNS